MKATHQNTDKNILIIPHNVGTDLIKIDSIVHCKANNVYCFIYLNNGTKLTVCKTLKAILEKLPRYKFLKLHRSHVVNIEFINRYVNGIEGYVVLFDGTKISVARSQKKQLNEIIKSL